MKLPALWRNQLDLSYDEREMLKSMTYLHNPSYDMMKVVMLFPHMEDENLIITGEAFTHYLHIDWESQTAMFSIQKAHCTCLMPMLATFPKTPSSSMNTFLSVSMGLRSPTAISTALSQIMLRISMTTRNY